MIVYSVLKFRASRRRRRDGPPIHGHTGIEIVWTAVPAVLVTAISSSARSCSRRTTTPATNPLRIDVTAQQFAWKFEYRTRRVVGQAAPAASNRAVKLTLHALDVIHSFWVPEFGQKPDAVPGDRDDARDHADADRQLHVICTELCGLGHSPMRARVQVVSRADYDAFLEERGGRRRRRGAETARRSSPPRAAAAATRSSPPAPTPQVGPTLDDARSRGGTELEEFVRESIVDPNAIVAPGYQAGVMPTTYGATLTDEQLDALVQYLRRGPGEG